MSPSDRGPTPPTKVGGRSLTLQLMLFALLPLTALLVFIAYGSLGLHSQAMRSLVGDREARTARAAADAIEEQTRQLGQAVRGLAVLAESSADAGSALTASSYLLQDFEGGLTILTADGLVMASTGPTAWQDLSLKELLEASRVAGEPAFSEPGLLGDLAPSMTVVVFANGDRSAAGAFDPQNLAARLLNDAFPPQSPARVWLLDPQLQTLYQRSSSTSGAFDARRLPVVQDALDGRAGVEFVNAEGEEHVVAYEAVQPLGWALILEEPWESVDSPLLRRTQAAPLVLIPALLLSLVALAFAVRQVVQPLRSLERKSAELGRGDFAALEEPVGGIREIKSLQQTLVQMARRLRSSQEAVRRYAGAVTRSQEDERRRVARELHDDTVQALIALDQRTQLAQKAAQQDPGRAGEQLSELRSMTQTLLKEVRRIIGALRPIYLEDLGLPAALEMLAQDTARSAGIPVEIRSSGDPRRLTNEQEIAVFRIAQEALSNIARHARATSARMEMRFAPDRFSLILEDDGVGFSVPDPFVDLDASGHYGLMGMQERAELVNGRFSLRSMPGGGARLSLEIPL